jgi:hypothetical protein
LLVSKEVRVAIKIRDHAALNEAQDGWRAGEPNSHQVEQIWRFLVQSGKFRPAVDGCASACIVDI